MVKKTKFDGVKKNTMFDGKRSLNKLLMFKKAKIDVEKTICD